MIYIRLFWEFFKTGLFAVGGGLATLPFLYEIAEKWGWYTKEQVANMIAISECTPGPLGVKMAAYSGYLTAGFPGLIVASVGLVFPSVIIILIIAYFLKAFRQNIWVESAFYGLRPASTGLIGAACVSVVMISLVNLERFQLTGAVFDLLRWKGVLLAAILLALTNIKKTKSIHPIVYLLSSAVIGAVFHFAGA